MIRVLSASMQILPMRMRLPFRYGVVTVTAIEQCFVRVMALIDGVEQHGISAEGLAPKWFVKDPAQSIDDDVAAQKRAINWACRCAETIAPAASVFEFWQQLYAEALSALPDMPALLRSFAVSLIERALIDAFCRARSLSFAAALQRNAFGIRLGAVHSELGDSQPADHLPARPLPAIRLRHTVGMIDPLTATDATASEDGLPVALEDCIRAYGLTHFKIKLSGNVMADIERLEAIADVLHANCAENFAFTLDGNEQFASIEVFRAAWEAITAVPRLRPMLKQLLFVEQPLQRTVALSDEAAAALHAWRDHPALIIDESDGELDSVRNALECGYAGASHKNCKGVFKGVANACLAAARTQASGIRPLISGEDLCTIGPVALLQDLAVMAVIGVGHVERNGHHYFRGLSGYPERLQARMLRQHGDLYHERIPGIAALRVHAGGLTVDSVVRAPFGCALEVNETTELVKVERETQA
jgi:hypothetical protein